MEVGEERGPEWKAMVMPSQRGLSKDWSLIGGLGLSYRILNISFLEKRFISLINSNWSTL